VSHVVHLGDCIDGMETLADGSIDVVLSDPPYSEHVDANSLRGRGHRPGGAKLDLGFAPLTIAQMEALTNRFARVAKRWVVVFCAVEMVHDWRGAMTSAGLDYVRCGAWLKDGATPQFTGDRPGTGFEAIVIAHRPGKKRWNGGGKLGLWRNATAYRDQDEVIHTTQKPVALMEALVRDFTDPGDLILDPFAGSGTTGVACKRLGRRFIGWELNQKYQAAAQRRIDATHEQLELVRVKKPKEKQSALDFGDKAAG
jgi:DNA modification methylase